MDKKSYIYNNEEKKRVIAISEPDVSSSMENTVYEESLEFAETISRDKNPSEISSVKRQRKVLRLGEYRIIKEISRGAMGIVYEAIQERLNRKVALKMMSIGASHDKNAVERFERESFAAAKLKHQGIVQVYDSGKDKNTYFYIMEYIEGRTIGDVMYHDTLSFEEMAQFMLQAASALDYAHKNGVIHRDIKPSNILLTVNDEIKITDFGLAKMVDSNTLTHTGDTLGTPMYMSPEQVGERKIKVDHRTDIYSLGVTFYEMLSLHPPYDAENIHTLIRKIIHSEPQPLRKISTIVPGELETICQKSMEKEPNRRYQSAGEMAADLDRFLKHIPITAKPVGLLGRINKFIIRNKAISALSFFFIIIMTFLSAYFVHRIIDEKNIAVNEQKLAQNRLLEIYEEQGRRELLGGNHLRALVYLSEVYGAGKNSRTLQYLISEALIPLKTLRYAKPVNPAFDLFSERASKISISPDNTYFAVPKDQKTAVIYALANGKEIAVLQGHNAAIHSLKYSFDAKLIITAGEDGTLRIWDSKTGRPLRILGHNMPVTYANFSHDNTKVVTTTRDAIRVWDVKSGAVLRVLRGEDIKPDNRRTGRIVMSYAAFSNDDKKIVITTERKGGYSYAHILDAGNYAIFRNLRHRHGLTLAEFSPDNRFLAIASKDEMVHIWNVSTGKNIFTIQVTRFNDNGSHFSPDSTKIVLPEKNFVRVYDPYTGTTIGTIKGHTGMVTDCRFSHEGRFILTASADWTARIWDAVSLKQSAALEGHYGEVQRFYIDGLSTNVITAGASVRVWDITRIPRKKVINTGGNVDFVSVNASGTQFISRYRSTNNIKTWDAATGIIQASYNIVFKGDDQPGEMKRILRKKDGRYYIFDTLKKRITSTIDTENGNLVAAVFDPTREKLALVTRHNKIEKNRYEARVLVYNAGTGDRLAEVKGAVSLLEPVNIRFSPDGKKIVIRGVAHKGLILNAEDGKQLGTFTPAPDGNIRFTPDGKKFMIIVPAEKTIYLRSIRTGKLLKIISDPGERAEFNQSSNLIVSTSGKIWDIEKGKVVSDLIGHSAKLSDVGFTPDGEWVFTGANDGTVKLWETKKGTLLTTFKDHDAWARISDVICDRAGKKIISGGSDGKIIQREFSLNHITPDELSLIIHKYVPWKLVDGQLLSTEPEFLPENTVISAPRTKDASEEEKTLRIHYRHKKHRFENYRASNVWIWTGGNWRGIREFSGEDNFGKYTDIDLEDLDNPGSVEILVKHESSVPPDKKRTWDRSKGNEIWLIHGNRRLYTSLPRY